MKIQIMVLKEIRRAKGKVTVKELMSFCNLREMQVHSALVDLKRRKLIIKEKISSGAKRNIPPENKIYVRLNEKNEKRINWVLKNA